MADFNWGNLLGGLASAGASVYTANQQQKAAKQAAEAQQQAQQSAINYAQQQSAPYSQLGTQAIGQLMGVANGTNNLSSDPGTQYMSDQAQKAITRAAAARGNVGSARTMSELMRSAGDYANTGYNNAYNRLAQMAGIGQNATNQNINTYTNAMTGIGNAQAASNIAGSNARTSGYSGLANAVGGYLANGGYDQLAGGAKNLYSSLFGGDRNSNLQFGDPGWSK